MFTTPTKSAHLNLNELIDSHRRELGSQQSTLGSNGPSPAQLLRLTPRELIAELEQAKENAAEAALAVRSATTPCTPRMTRVRSADVATTPAARGSELTRTFQRFHEAEQATRQVKDSLIGSSESLETGLIKAEGLLLQLEHQAQTDQREHDELVKQLTTVSASVASLVERVQASRARGDQVEATCRAVDATCAEHDRSMLAHHQFVQAQQQRMAENQAVQVTKVPVAQPATPTRRVLVWCLLVVSAAMIGALLRPPTLPTLLSGPTWAPVAARVCNATRPTQDLVDTVFMHGDVAAAQPSPAWSVLLADRSTSAAAAAAAAAAWLSEAVQASARGATAACTAVDWPAHVRAARSWGAAWTRTGWSIALGGWRHLRAVDLSVQQQAVGNWTGSAAARLRELSAASASELGPAVAAAVHQAAAAVNRTAVLAGPAAAALVNATVELGPAMKAAVNRTAALAGPATAALAHATVELGPAVTAALDRVVALAGPFAAAVVSATARLGPAVAAAFNRAVALAGPTAAAVAGAMVGLGPVVAAAAHCTWSAVVAAANQTRELGGPAVAAAINATAATGGLVLAKAQLAWSHAWAAAVPLAARVRDFAADVVDLDALAKWSTALLAPTPPPPPPMSAASWRNVLEQSAVSRPQPRPHTAEPAQPRASGAVEGEF